MFERQFDLMNNLAFSATWRPRIRENIFVSCHVVMCFGGFGLGLFFEFLSFAIYQFILVLLLEVFRFSSFRCLFFDVSFHLCLMVSLFSVV